MGGGVAAMGVAMVMVMVVVVATLLDEVDPTPVPSLLGRPRHRVGLEDVNSIVDFAFLIALQLVKIIICSCALFPTFFVPRFSRRRRCQED